MLRQEIQLYLGNQVTEKMVDQSLLITILSGTGCQVLLHEMGEVRKQSKKTIQFL